MDAPPSCSSLADISPESVPPRTLRNIQLTLHHISSELHTHAALLDRLWYKSRAQHRRSVWLKSVEGLRRCFSRVLYKERKTWHTVEGGASKQRCTTQARKWTSMSASQASRGASGRTNQALHCRTSSSRISMDQREVEEKLQGFERRHRQAEMQTLMAFENSQDSDSLIRLANKILVLAFELDEIIQRSARCHALLETHLKTPPAPTFAPLLATLMSFCASAFTTSQALLWSDHSGLSSVTAQPGKADGGATNTRALALSRIYRLILDAQKSPMRYRPPLQLGVIVAKTCSSHKLRLKLMNEIQYSGSARTLPEALERDTNRPASPKDSQMIRSAPTDSALKRRALDEDIGEAV